MESNTIRIAFLGAGRVAQHYKDIFQSGIISSYEIVAICDTDDYKSHQLSLDFKCPSYRDIQEMVDKSKPDLILVLTPSGLHYRHALLALNLGCHVLVEKPITMIPSEAEHLLSISLANNLLLTVAFQNRLNPAIRILKQAVDNGRFGKITTATVRLRWCRYQDYYEDGWHGTWANDGGVINQQAIHHVDALNWLVGPVESVCSTISNRLNLLEAEDTMVALLKFSNGSLGTLEATTAARPKDVEASLSIVGEKGIAVVGGIALNNVETWDFVDSTPEDKNIKDKYSLDVPNGYGLSHGPLLQSIIDNIKQGIFDSPIPVPECIATSQLIHAMYSSYEVGGWVNLLNQPLSKKLGKVTHGNRE